MPALTLTRPRAPDPTPAELMPAAVGQAVDFVSHGRAFRVARIARTAYRLRDLADSSRSVVGTREAIADELSTALASGVLAGPDGSPW